VKRTLDKLGLLGGGSRSHPFLARGEMTTVYMFLGEDAKTQNHLVLGEIPAVEGGDRARGLVEEKNVKTERTKPKWVSGSNLREVQAST